MLTYLTDIPPLFIQLLLTAVFSLIIGLEQRTQHPKDEEPLTFGTDRTFTFIGLFGFALLVADTATKSLYLGGGLILSLLLGIFYFHKIRDRNHYGLTSIFLALLTYAMPLLIVTQPHWLAMTFFVVVLLMAESKKSFGEFSEKIDRDEFITLAKFILIAGIILPIVPDQQVSTFLTCRPTKFGLRLWLFPLFLT